MTLFQTVLALPTLFQVSIPKLTKFCLGLCKDNSHFRKYLFDHLDVDNEVDKITERFAAYVTECKTSAETQMAPAWQREWHGLVEDSLFVKVDRTVSPTST